MNFFLHDNCYYFCACVSIIRKVFIGGFLSPMLPTSKILFFVLYILTIWIQELIKPFILRIFLGVPSTTTCLELDTDLVSKCVFVCIFIWQPITLTQCYQWSLLNEFSNGMILANFIAFHFALSFCEITQIPSWDMFIKLVRCFYFQCKDSVGWNPSMKPPLYLILFVDDFLKQSNGMLTMYTLKNPSFPEWVFSLTV